MTRPYTKREFPKPQVNAVEWKGRVNDLGTLWRYASETHDLIVDSEDQSVTIIQRSGERLHCPKGGKIGINNQGELYVHGRKAKPTPSTHAEKP